MSDIGAILAEFTKLSTMMGELKGNQETTNRKLDEVIAHQKITNGRVNKHDDVLEKHTTQLSAIAEIKKNSETQSEFVQRVYSELVRKKNRNEAVINFVKGVYLRLYTVFTEKFYLIFTSAILLYIVIQLAEHYDWAQKMIDLI